MRSIQRILIVAAAFLFPIVGCSGGASPLAVEDEARSPGSIALMEEGLDEPDGATNQEGTDEADGANGDTHSE